MLDNIHDLWKRKRVCKIKCKGVCTVDMDNVRRQLEVGLSNLNWAFLFFTIRKGPFSRKIRNYVLCPSLRGF